jgi:hypothetical protein
MTALGKLNPALLLGTVATALGASRVVEETAAPQEHDQFHHPRMRMTAGWKHRARLKGKRRMRNAMAKASRKRNRNA